MIPYLIISVMPLMLNFVCRNSINSNDQTVRQKTIKGYLLVCGLILFFFLALRSRYIGSTDADNYYSNWKLLSLTSFENLKILIKDSKMESGYLYTVWALSHIIKNPQFVFVFSGLLFTVAVCRFIYKNSEDVTLSMTMYITLGLLSFMLQGLRQSIAMSICLFSVEFCKKRKLIPFLLIVILAMQFHTSAIVFLPMYIIYGFTLKAINVLAAGAVSAVLLLASNKLVAIGNEAFDREYGATVDSGGFIATVIYVLILAAAFLFARDKKYDKNFSFFVYMTILGLCFYLMRYVGTLAVERISFYFMFGQIIVLPAVINRLKTNEKQAVKFLVYLLCFALFAYRLRGSDLVPYEFFWQGVWI